MANNIIVDVSQIYNAIQDIQDIKAEINRENVIINGIAKTLKDGKHFSKTYPLKGNSWTQTTVGGKHQRSLTIKYSGVHFVVAPTVHVTIEGNHSGLSVHIHGNAHDGCQINVQKSSGKFTTADLAHKIHLTANGY
jgi:hypothetical protein